MMVSSVPQLPLPEYKPLAEGAAVERVTEAPPTAETFLSLPSAKKPIHSLSGEKNGADAPSVPLIGLCFETIHGAQVKLRNAALTCHVNEVVSVG